eukprot:scaffold9928_cov63-Phaeocystis_antarctica.AAC.4
MLGVPLGHVAVRAAPVVPRARLLGHEVGVRRAAHARRDPRQHRGRRLGRGVETAEAGRRVGGLLRAADGLDPGLAQAAHRARLGTAGARAAAERAPQLGHAVLVAPVVPHLLRVNVALEALVGRPARARRQLSGRHGAQPLGDGLLLLLIRLGRARDGRSLVQMARGVVVGVARIEAHHRREARLPRRVLEQTGHVAVVVVDDGHDAAVVRGHGAQVGRRQPAVGSALDPLALLEDLVEHLVVGRARVALPRHGLGPRGEHPGGTDGLVEVDHAAARGGGAGVGVVGLIAPEVEDGHVAAAIGPAARDEEVGEAVELEVGVEEDHGQSVGLQLVQDERRLGGDHLEAELLSALHGAGAEGVGRQQPGLAADADARARAEQALGFVLVVRRVEGDTDELVVGGLADGAHHHVGGGEVDAARA